MPAFRSEADAMTAQASDLLAGLAIGLVLLTLMLVLP